jgi:3-phenylpropionate/cinnamic acid dioxygenase small subunit
VISLSRNLETQLLVQEFLYREAELLDRRRFRDWLELLAPDFKYKMPVRHTVYWKSLDEEFDDLEHGMQYFDEDKESMSTRVYKLETNTAWAEVPPSRTRRLITNVRVQSDDGNELEVESYFMVYKSRLEKTEDTYIGERLDRLRRVGDSFQLVSRVVRLDQTVVMVKNISIFL